MDGYDYITEGQMDAVRREVLRQRENGTGIREIVGWIYGLYQDYLISEDQERELYALADPGEEWNSPSEYWWEQDGGNPLEEAIGY